MSLRIMMPKLRMVWQRESDRLQADHAKSVRERTYVTQKLTLLALLHIINL
jgi:hypothetical protein